MFNSTKTIGPKHPTNGDRADRAELALLAYVRDYPAQDTMSKETIRDLMADLMHLMDREGIMVSEQVQSAAHHWEEER